jgi:hypothetical protein
MRDLTANVNARRTVTHDRRILLDQDTQLGKRYFSDVPRWVEAIDPLLTDSVRGPPLVQVLLTLLEMRDSELPWAEAAMAFENDERWLSNALRTIGFSLKRRVYARQTSENGTVADDERIIEYEAVVRQPSLPLNMLARCLLVVAGGVDVATARQIAQCAWQPAFARVACVARVAACATRHAVAREPGADGESRRRRASASLVDRARCCGRGGARLVACLGGGDGTARLDWRWRQRAQRRQQWLSCGATRQQP